MRIAYLHYLYGRQDGTRDRTRNFLDAIRGLGHEVEMRGLNLAPPEPGRNGDGEADPTARQVLRAALKKRFGRYLHEPKDLLWNARYLRRELEVLRELQPDVVMVRPLSLIVSPAISTRRLGLPLVLEIHAPISELRQLRQYVHLPVVDRWAEGFRLRRAQAITTVSTSLRDHLVSRYGLPQKKFVVTPNGTHPERFSRQVPPDPELAPRLLGEGEEKNVVVGFTGSFQAWHGAALLARMTQRVAAAEERARFLFVGDGPGAGELRRETDRLGERAILTGWLAHDRMPGLVSLLDIGVLPESDFYRCPLKLLEWMAAGLAIVVPRHGPIEEMIEEDVEGLFFTPGDEDGLVDAVRRLIGDPELRSRLGAAAARRVAETMTWRHSAERAVEACELALRRFKS